MATSSAGTLLTECLFQTWAPDAQDVLLVPMIDLDAPTVEAVGSKTAAGVLRSLVSNSGLPVVLASVLVVR
ncbi:MAG: hypothetical protein HS113_23965 [Verrucomicrobiales bacterium]|nr:hypothetical protein [Verrucomicrobiales bacterium]